MREFKMTANKKGELGMKELVMMLLAIIAAFFIIYLAVKTLGVLG